MVLYTNAVECIEDLNKECPVKVNKQVNKILHSEAESEALV